MNLYFIKRGPRPDHHRAPYHPYLICTRKGVAKWEAGWTGDQAWVWERFDAKDDAGGWLLTRWEGLVIDYGHLVRTCRLPDGTPVAFYHRHRDLGFEHIEGYGRMWRGYSEELQEPWSLLSQTVWWSVSRIPEWLEKAGVQVPTDDFSQRRIVEAVRYADEEEGKRERRCQRPEWWPEPEAEKTEVAA